MLRLQQMVGCVVALLGIASSCSAGIRPSFEADSSTWAATDIVVVSDDGKTRPTVTVIEVWKGALQPGDSIVVTGLPASTDPKPNLAWNDSAFPDAVSGGRVVFFLRHEAAGVDAKRTEGKWKSTFSNYLFASAAFIRGGEVWAFRQVINPGPSTLQPWGTITDLKSAVQSTLATQVALGRARATADPAERVRALRPFALSPEIYISGQALKEMGSCGKVALPTLREIAFDELIHPRSSLEAIAAAAGKDAGAVVTDILSEEVAYWKDLAPKLGAGWWNATPYGDALHNHYNRIYFILESLERCRPAEARRPVAELRDLWNQSGDREFGKRVTDECDLLLSMLPNGEEKKPAP